MPSPFVYWAQTDTHVFLKVDVKQVQEEQCEVRIDEEEVEFSALGVGGQGKQANYHFIVEFFLPVDAAESTYEVNSSRDDGSGFRIKFWN